MHRALRWHLGKRNVAAVGRRSPSDAFPATALPADAVRALVFFEVQPLEEDQGN